MFGFLKKLFSHYGEDEVAGRAAALSYYTIFSLGPLLFLIFGIIGLVVQHSGARASLINNLSGVIGPQAAQTLSGSLSSQGLGSKTGLAFWVGGVGLILGAIGIFGQLQQSLNAILHVKASPGAGRKPMIRQKIISLVLVGLICILLLASVLASTLISSLGGTHGAQHFLFFVIDLVISVAVLGLAIGLLYRFLPAIKIAWSIILKTSFIVALMFSIGKLVLGIIIGHNGTISAYGAAGSLIALLLWIFYSGQIFYFGAVGLRVYLDDHPAQLAPRYKAKEGVLKISRLNKPLRAGLPARLGQKFADGLSRGWRS